MKEYITCIIVSVYYLDVDKWASDYCLTPLDQSFSLCTSQWKPVAFQRDDDGVCLVLYQHT